MQAALDTKYHPSEQILFFDLEFFLIYALPFNTLIQKDDIPEFNNLVGERAWLETIRSAFISNTAIERFQNPEFEVSKAKKTNLTEKHTFSDHFSREMMPLVFRANYREGILSDDFLIIGRELSISKDGAISIILHIRQDTSRNTNFTRYAINPLVEKARDLRKASENLVFEILDDFVNEWNRCDSILTVKEVDRHAVISKTHKYEIILFDYEISSGKRLPVKELYEEKNVHLLRQLVGLCRMTSPQACAKYSYQFLHNFTRFDVGNRDDELWLIYDERFLRYHPERRSVRIIERGFDDVIIGINVLMQVKAILEYINFWAYENIISLKKSLSLPSRQNVKKGEFSIDITISDINKMLPFILDPLIIARNITHEFYHKVITTAIDKLRIEELAVLARSHFYDLYNISTMAKNIQDVSLSNRLADDTRKLTKWLYALTILIILLMIIQITLGICDKEAIHAAMVYLKGIFLP